MSEDSSPSSWAHEASLLWNSPKIDKCYEILSKTYKISVPSQKSTSNSNVNLDSNKNKTKASSLASSTLNTTNLAQNSDKSYSKMHQKIDLPSESIQNGLAKLIEDHDFAALHNLALSHYLQSGASPKWRWNDFIAHFLIFSPNEAQISNLSSNPDSSSQSASCSSNERQNSEQSGKENIAIRVTAGSSLDPSTYAMDTIESILASLGPQHPISFYNLIILHYAKGLHSLAIKICEDIVDTLVPALLQAKHHFLIKFSILFLHICIKMNKAQNQKLQSLLPETEKLLTTSLQSTQGPDLDSVHEQNVWFHILRAQTSIMMSKMKSSKKDVFSMTTAFTNWANSRAAGTDQTTSSMEEKIIFDFKSPEMISAYSAMQFVKSRLLGLRNNFEKAEAELKETQIISTSFPSFYYNNLGILAFQRKKHAVASLYLLKASQENQKSKQLSISKELPTSKKSSISTYSNFIQTFNNNNINRSDVSADVAYNMGLEMLMMSKFDGAVKCFSDVTTRLNSSTSDSHHLGMSFLRLSESQVHLYASMIKTQLQAVPSASAKPSHHTQPKTVSEVFREGGYIHLESKTMSAESDAILLSALNSASTALILFNKDPNPELTQRDYLVLICVSTLLSWISLEMENFIQARNWSKKAFEVHKKSEASFTASPIFSSQQLSASEKSQLDHYYFLAHIYHAEAELKLDNTEAAISILQDAPVHLSKYPLCPSEHHLVGDSKQSPLDLSSSVNSKAALYCNLAAVYIIKNDHLQAEKLLSQVLTQSPSLLPAIALRVYLEMRSGNVMNAAKLLCEYRVQEIVNIHTSTS